MVSQDMTWTLSLGTDELTGCDVVGFPAGQTLVFLTRALGLAGDHVGPGGVGMERDWA